MALVEGTILKSKYATSIQRVQTSWQIRADAILTTGYVDTSWLDTADYTASQLTFLFKYTQGSLTSLEWKVFVSDNESDWYQETTESVAAGVITETPDYYTNTADGNFFFTLPVTSRFFKLSVKGTGTVNGSTLQIKALGRW